MKAHTSGFKENLIELGRELKGVITYGNTVLEDEIYSITPHYNADLLKSVMKQLDLELSVDIPLETVINCQIGIKVGNDYEMLDFGNYVVYDSEKQEDAGTYKITCYDKLLYSMKQNEDLEVEYPISIKNYLTALANKIGLTVANTSFNNQNMQIPSELYLGLEYTYRDILDEIAQATGSIICLNVNDEIVVKYPTTTNDTIDEDFLKDVNVDFGQKYGPINSIVLSRSGESDNVYLRDEDSVEENGLTEIKIVDNQIMNFNNRSDFLSGILNALDGLYYYINDFNSTGILYYDIADLYNVQIGQNIYQCLMLNDEINITTGIEEIVHTDIPQKSETDYSKADKTDMRINQTYLIVDKQNQRIDSVVNTVTEQNSKISQITQTVDELNSKIQDIADITTYGESDRAYVELTGINQSEPIMIKVHPTSTNISYLYPRANLYPSDNLYMTNRIIRFIRTYEENGETLTENIDYELPDDLLRYSSTVYDEFYLDYDSQTCQVIKRCAYNADGTVRALGTEIVTDYPYPQILLEDGDYEIQLLGYDFGYLYVRLMAQNIYTTQFATKAELHSEINQTADSINLEVSKKVGEDEVISKINQSSEAITIDANKINLSGKTINLTSDNIAIASSNFNVTKNGDLSCSNANITGGKIVLESEVDTVQPSIKIINPNQPSTYCEMSSGLLKGYGDNFLHVQFYYNIGVLVIRASSGSRTMIGGGYIGLRDDSENLNIELDAITGKITCVSLTQTSLETEKKNFEKFENALDVIKNIDIYKYNLKNEKDNDKKHIGFVIGNDFNYRKEVTSKENDGVDIYSFVSVCCQAIKEQQEQIEQMKKEIEELKRREK